MKYEEELYDSRSSWLLSFILGGLVGAAIALLMAPKPGRQTRQDLLDLATDARGKEAKSQYAHLLRQNGKWT